MKAVIAILAFIFTNVCIGGEAKISGDIDCNGKADKAEILQTKEMVWLLVKSDDGKLNVLSFGLGNSKSQSSLCGKIASLSKNSLTDISSMFEGENPEGYAPSKSCIGLELAAGECDPINVYWNHKKNTLSWWRM